MPSSAARGIVVKFQWPSKDLKGPTDGVTGSSDGLEGPSVSVKWPSSGVKGPSDGQMKGHIQWRGNFFQTGGAEP